VDAEFSALDREGRSASSEVDASQVFAGPPRSQLATGRAVAEIWMGRKQRSP
jgi:hypothetical protein